MDAEPTKAQLVDEVPSSFDTTRLTFDGLRGDAARHLDPVSLRAALDALPPAPTDRGTVDLLVSRTASFGRVLHERVRLTRALPSTRMNHSLAAPSSRQMASPGNSSRTVITPASSSRSSNEKRTKSGWDSRVSSATGSGALMASLTRSAPQDQGHSH